MPSVDRRMHPDLRDCLERANPYVYHHVEISAPNTSRVLRRATDQFLYGPDPRVSESPTNGLQDYGGAVGIVSTASQIASFSTESSDIDIRPQPTASRLKGLGWQLDPAFGRAVLRTFRAKIFRNSRPAPFGAFRYQSRLELQIYRARAIPGAMIRQQNGQTTSRPWIDYAFEPLLNPAPVLSVAEVQQAPAWTQFDLRNYQLVIDPAPPRVKRVGGSGGSTWGTVAHELPIYYFVITALDLSTGVDNGIVWRHDAVTARSLAGVGTFNRRWWMRGGEEEQWYEDIFNDVPCAQLEIETFDPPGAATAVQAVYKIDQGAVPSAASEGRVVLERGVPPGTALTAELSTAGSGGPWTAVTHDAVVAVKQQQYHMRVTWTPSANLRATPYLFALGLEFRERFDASAEARVEFLPRQIEPPYLRGAVGTASLAIVRPGVRDYQDLASRLGSQYAPTMLEADIYLASAHPSITRDKWLHLERAMVSNREPSATSEKFSLLSYLQRLKRKIPRKEEQQPNTVHTVDAGSTLTLVKVKTSTPLQETGSGGYLGKGYYLRVRQSANPEIPAGYKQTIDSSTGTTDLNFVSDLPGALADGDIIEIHSSIYSAAKLSWKDADPYDAWWDILSVRLGIPTERIGHAALPNGGLPRTLAQRAPGDTTTQNKLRVTNQIESQEDAADAIAELSFILGGGTTEYQGQIVFVQVYPHLSPSLTPIIPLPAPAAYFDVRDYYGGRFSPGLEQRASVVTGEYGVDATSAQAGGARTTTFIDVDAVNWLTRQDLEEFGSSEMPDGISRWCWNSYDAGLYLMTVLTRQVGLAASTGLRLFNWSTLAPYPTLAPGDVVVIVTDEYTDHNPATGEELRGVLAIQCVLIGVQYGGRAFTGYVLGLNGNVVKVAGGTPGTVSGATAPIAVPTDFDVAQDVVSTPTGGFPELAATSTPPATPFLARMEYEIRQQRTGAGLAWDTLPIRVEQGGTAGDDRIKADWNTTYQITPVTVSIGGTRTRGTGSLVKEVAIGPNPAATPVIGTPIAYSDRIEYPVTFDPATTRIEVWSDEDSATFPAVSQYKVGAHVDDLHRGDGLSQLLALPLAAGSNWRVTTFVCFDALDGMGQIITVGPTQGAAPALPPDITGTPTSVGVTESTATVGVPMPAAGLAAGDYIRVYRDGLYVFEVLRTAGAGATQNVTDAGPLTPGQSYVYTFKLKNAAGFESQNASPSRTMTTSAGTIPTPSCTISNYSTSAQGFYVTVTPAPGTPSGVTWHVKHSTDGSAFTLGLGDSTTTTIFHSHPQDGAAHGEKVKVYGTKAGWTQSADSAESSQKFIPA